MSADKHTCVRPHAGAKWHQALTWGSNEAFWLTRCGHLFYKRTAEKAPVGAQPACSNCVRHARKEAEQ